MIGVSFVPDDPHIAITLPLSTAIALKRFLGRSTLAELAGKGLDRLWVELSRKVL